MGGVLRADPLWVETFTGLPMSRFQRLLRVVRERGGEGPGKGRGRGRPWCLALPERVLLVAVYYRTNLTMRQLARLFGICPATVCRVIQRLGPLLALELAARPAEAVERLWIADGTLIPVRDRTVAASSKNYRFSANVQVIIDADTRLWWPPAGRHRATRPTLTPGGTPACPPSARTSPSWPTAPAPGPTYTFTGFYQPVDNQPTVNTMQAGRAVAVKFSLGGDQGLNIFAPGYPASQTYNGQSGEPTDEVEQTSTAGQSSLSTTPRPTPTPTYGRLAAPGQASTATSTSASTTAAATPPTSSSADPRRVEQPQYTVPGGSPPGTGMTPPTPRPPRPPGFRLVIQAGVWRLAPWCTAKAEQPLKELEGDGGVRSMSPWCVAGLDGGPP